MACGVLARNTAETGTFTPNGFPIRRARFNALIDVAPNSKISASLSAVHPTNREMPQYEFQRRFRLRLGSDSVPSNAASLRWSSLPVSVTGNAATRCNTFGTNTAGNRACTADRICCSSTVSAGATVYNAARPAGTGSTITLPTPGTAPITRSTSPGSTRTPWTLTCRSCRPRNRMSPSAPRMPTSPVR